MKFNKKYTLTNIYLLRVSVYLCLLLSLVLPCYAQQNTELKHSGQIIAKTGDTITGLNISNLEGPCIIVQNSTNVTITKNRIGPCGKDPNYQVGVFVNQSHTLQITNNFFEEISSALYALDNEIGKLIFAGNYATKIKGPFPRGQLAQLNKYSGPDIILSCNISDQLIGGYLNIDGRGGPEDHINIYKSSGTTLSPIKIINNKIRGGGSPTGGGILAVDGGEGGNILIKDNILVDPGQYGIAIASGMNIEIDENKIYGNQNAWTNVGIYIWNQAKKSLCSDHKVTNNKIKYINKKGLSNPYWDSKNCGVVKIANNSLQDLEINEKIWDLDFDNCKYKYKEFNNLKK